MNLSTLTLQQKLKSTMIFNNYDSSILKHKNTNSLVNYDIKGDDLQEYSEIVPPAMPIARILGTNSHYALIAYTHYGWNKLIEVSVKALPLSELNNFTYLSDLVKDLRKIGYVISSPDEQKYEYKVANHIYLDTKKGVHDVTPQAVLFASEDYAIIEPTLNNKYNGKELMFVKNKINIASAKDILDNFETFRFEDCISQFLDNSHLYDEKYIKSQIKEAIYYNGNHEDKLDILGKVFSELYGQGHESNSNVMGL